MKRFPTAFFLACLTLGAWAQEFRHIDILVAYDQGAQRYVNTNRTTMASFATNAVAKMNTALVNSGITEFDFRLAGTTTIAATSTDVAKALSSITNTASSASAWHGVQKVRDEMGADIVTTLINTGSDVGTNGTGFSLEGSNYYHFADMAYNVCNIRAVAGGHTMTHEVGHNLGAGHAPNVAEEDQPGPQLYLDSAAYLFEVSNVWYHTIMGYNTDGIHKDRVYEEVPLFSSPKLTWMGVPAGVAGSSDNVATLRVTYDRASKWRSPGVEAGEDLVQALGATQFMWTTSADFPWAYASNTLWQVTTVESSPDFLGVTNADYRTWLQADIAGKGVVGVNFYYLASMYNSSFTLTCDGTVLWQDVASGDDTNHISQAWTPVFVEIPSGAKKLTFSFNQEGAFGGFNGVCLAALEINQALPPVLDPATTVYLDTATTFEDRLTVTLTAPEGRKGTLYYYLVDESGTATPYQVYSKPLTITDSTFVGGIFVDSKSGIAYSDVTSGYYLKKYPEVVPGEWSRDVAGVKTAAATNGNLIVAAFLSATNEVHQQALRTVVADEKFQTWAKASGVYLVGADEQYHLDTRTLDYFYDLYYDTVSRTNNFFYTSMAFALPSAPTNGVATGTGTSGYRIAGVTYDGTVDSLILGMSSAATGGHPLYAPVVENDQEVYSYPCTVTLRNRAGMGTVYYTLDGTTPTPATGLRYTDGISVDRETVLTAVTYLDSGMYGPALVKTIRSYNDIFATTGGVWTVTGPYGWQQTAESPRTGGYYAGSIGEGTVTNYVSTLTAQFVGRGSLDFTCRICVCGTNNYVSCLANGSEVMHQDRTWKDYGGNTCITNTVHLELSEATNTVSWSYHVSDFEHDYAYYFYDPTNRCASLWSGIWLWDVTWTPAGDAPVRVLKGGPFTETVDGVAWRFRVDGEKAWIGSGREYLSGCAVPLSSAGALTLPSRLGDRAVTGVSSYAFYRCGELTSVTIPSGVTTIGTRAFYRCSGLASVTIPASVTAIDANAFRSTALKTVHVSGESEKARVKALISASGFDCKGVTFVTP